MNFTLPYLRELFNYFFARSTEWITPKLRVASHTLFATHITAHIIDKFTFPSVSQRLGTLLYAMSIVSTCSLSNDFNSRNQSRQPDPNPTLAIKFTGWGLGNLKLLFYFNIGLQHQPFTRLLMRHTFF